MCVCAGGGGGGGGVQLAAVGEGGENDVRL